MKKHVSLFVAVLLSFLLFSCTQKNKNESSDTVDQQKKGVFSLGVGFIPDATGEEVSFGGTFAAVVIDEQKRIVKCFVDELDARPVLENGDSFDKVEYPTKHSLGEKYGMKGVSAIGKEWFEQADAFAKHCIGKTDRQVLESVGNDGKVAELVSSCTVNCDKLSMAVSQAVKAATDPFECEKDFLLGFSASCRITDSQMPTDTEDGKVIFRCVFSAAVTDTNGKVLNAFTDESETNIPFDKDGKPKDKDNTPVTKRTLGKDYGMQSASKIGKEWFEQIDAFTDYCKGKTAEQIVRGIGNDGKVEYLSSSCTVHVGEYAASLQKAIEKAK